MFRTGVIERYFEWLCGFIEDPDSDTYRKLLRHLYETEFVYTLSADGNRAADGVDMRVRFAEECHVPDVDLYLVGPCSILEMMVALADRVENQIMEDSEYGNRTSQWFWNMIVNLGLGGMTDDRFNVDLVDRVLYIFMSRTYDYDGTGGLFNLENPPMDMRNVEIWYQMNWWLNQNIG